MPNSASRAAIITMMNWPDDDRAGSADVLYNKYQPTRPATPQMTSLNGREVGSKKGQIWYLSLYERRQPSGAAVVIETRRKCHCECQMIVSGSGSGSGSDIDIDIHTGALSVWFLRKQQNVARRISFGWEVRDAAAWGKIAQAANGNVFMWRPNFPAGTSLPLPKCNLWREAHAKEVEAPKLISSIGCCDCTRLDLSLSLSCPRRVEGFLLLPSSFRKRRPSFRQTSSPHTN